MAQQSPSLALRHPPSPYPQGSYAQHPYAQSPYARSPSLPTPMAYAQPVFPPAAPRASIMDKALEFKYKFGRSPTLEERKELIGEITLQNFALDNHQRTQMSQQAELHAIGRVVGGMPPSPGGMMQMMPGGMPPGHYGSLHPPTTTNVPFRNESPANMQSGKNPPPSPNMISATHMQIQEEPRSLDPPPPPSMMPATNVQPPLGAATNVQLHEEPESSSSQLDVPTVGDSTVGSATLPRWAVLLLRSLRALHLVLLRLTGLLLRSLRALRRLQRV